MFQKIIISIITAFLWVGNSAFIFLPVNATNNVQAEQENYLTQTEVDDLLYMREEEKLAHDVYSFLADKWEMNIFIQIAESEQTHTNEIAALLREYQIPDPVTTEPGVFIDQNLQFLYNELILEGSVSLAAALKVGAKIEEIDILDLQAGNEDTNNFTVKTVYQNLKSGSENHLRSFVKVLLQKNNEVYEPQYLDDATYQTILTAVNNEPKRREGRS